MKIVGYGLTTIGEADRYMEETLKEFKRLCDETIILVNGYCPKEIELIEKYGFKWVKDGREWGVNQWLIKQDFITNHVAKLNPDWCVCLDMDEVLDKNLTKDWIKQAPLDAYHVFIVDLWNDKEHYKPESCFWNVRIWRWNGEVKFKQKPVHCGLAPEWAYHYHRHAPFILKHYGLMKKEDRTRKVRRYEKYDPKQIHLDPRYYSMLKSDTAKPFDEEKIHNQIAKEVESYNQTKPRIMKEKQPRKFAYVRNQAGFVVDIPIEHLAQTLKQPGMSFVGYEDNMSKEVENLFMEPLPDSLMGEALNEKQS